MAKDESSRNKRSPREDLPPIANPPDGSSPLADCEKASHSGPAPAARIPTPTSRPAMSTTPAVPATSHPAAAAHPQRRPVAGAATSQPRTEAPRSGAAPRRVESSFDRRKARSLVAAAAAASESEESELTPLEVAGAAVRSSPPFLASMMVHMVIVVLLGLVSFSQETEPARVIEATYAETLGEQLVDDSIMTNPLEGLTAVDTAEPVFSLSDSSFASPLAAVPEMSIQLEGTGTGAGGLEGIGVGEPSIGLGLSGRGTGARGTLLAAYGGTARTESSVGAALEWLRRNQHRDGSWSLTGPYEGGVTIENRTAATAMALIAFLGNGQTIESSKYGESVQRGFNALLKMQDSDGLFFHEGEPNQRMYSQAMATIAVCELYGMTKDSAYLAPAERALGYAARVQADDGRGGGGWRYQPREDVDTSVTGWFVMAFQSARMGGLDGHGPVLEKVSRYLDHVTEDGSTYRYRIDEDVRISMTAEALLCRQYLGWEREDARLAAGVRKILEQPIRWEEPNFYYWYYATQVLHHMGGDEWDAWNKVMREQLPQHQVKSGRERGSWNSAGDPYGYKGGRLYATCFCTFMLEVYYRHLPIYRR